MSERKTINARITALELEMKELEILYEQYFAGVEKLEPVKKRTALARNLRNFTNRRIIQTDLRFRYQNLASRYHTYSTYWDRILRLMDEGRYIRQKGGRLPPPPGDSQQPTVGPASEVERLHESLMAAHRACNMVGQVPSKEKIASFLDTQKEKIREKFGEREVRFEVVTEDGKPKIKVRAK